MKVGKCDQLLRNDGPINSDFHHYQYNIIWSKEEKILFMNTTSHLNKRKIDLSRKIKSLLNKIQYEVMIIFLKNSLKFNDTVLSKEVN